MNTPIKNAAEVAAALAGDPSIEKDVQTEICMSGLVTMLLRMRVAKGKTQEEVAEAMQCSPSKVSRLEAGNDVQLRWPDIVGYVRALGNDLCLVFEDSSLPAAERIKHYVMRIGEDLSGLATLARQVDGDTQIVRGIDQFYREVLFNFLIRFKDSSDRLNVLKIPAQCNAQCNIEEARLLAEHAEQPQQDSRALEEPVI